MNRKILYSSKSFLEVKKDIKKRRKKMTKQTTKTKWFIVLVVVVTLVLATLLFTTKTAEVTYTGHVDVEVINVEMIS